MSTIREKQKQLEKDRIADNKMVKGVFNFYEVRGGTLKFSYKKYKQEPLINYKLTDGEPYTIPLGVAKHLNTDGWYPIHTHTLGSNGLPSIKVGSKVRRYSFHGTDFGASEDFGANRVNDLVTVEASR